VYQGENKLFHTSLKSVVSSQFSDSNFLPIRKRTYGGPEGLSFSSSHKIPLSFLKKKIVPWKDYPSPSLQFPLVMRNYHALKTAVYCPSYPLALIRLSLAPLLGFNYLHCNLFT
jgi:hypothetical protein